MESILISPHLQNYKIIVTLHGLQLANVHLYSNETQFPGSLQKIETYHAFQMIFVAAPPPSRPSLHWKNNKKNPEFLGTEDNGRKAAV